MQQVAALLGASVHADALLLVFQLVWLLETVLVSGAVMPAIISRIYRVETERGAGEAARFFLHSALWCFGATTVYGLGLWLFADPVIALAAPGFDAEARDLCRDLLMFSIVTPLCLSLSEFSGMVNRLTQNGVWYSTPQLVTNLTALAGLVVGFQISGPEGAAKGMMLGLSIGSVTMAVVQGLVMPRDVAIKLWRYLKGGVTRFARIPEARPYWAAVFALVFAAVINELYLYVDFYFASTVREGGIGLVSYAGRLASLTNMLLISSAFVILEPRWAQGLAEDETSAWRRLIGPDAIGLLSLLATPIVALTVFAPETVTLIYHIGAMGSSDAATLIELTRIYGVSVLFISGALILARALVLQGQARWLVIVSLLVLPAKVLLTAGLSTRLGLAGLAFATLGALTLQAAGYAVVLLRSGVGLRLRGAVHAMARLAIVFGATFGVAWTLQGLNVPGPLGFLAALTLVGVVNVAVGLGMRFAYADAVMALLSPRGWRSRLVKLLGRR
jgi:putative peptidoglycan lipid II flippase